MASCKVNLIVWKKFDEKVVLEQRDAEKNVLTVFFYRFKFLIHFFLCFFIF